MSKEQHQELLNRLLQQVMKDLKKRMFPRRHVRLLNGPVEISSSNLEYSAAGRYEHEELKRCAYKHHIFIDSEYIEDYLTAGHGTRLFYKGRIKNIIAHELIHAFVLERYKDLIDIENVNHDGSPVFLAISAYLNIDSGHKSWKSFKYTALYEEVKKCNNYDEVENILIRTMLNYEKIFKDLEYMINRDKNIVYINYYRFGNGTITGLKGNLTSTFYTKGTLCKLNHFYIGSNIDISKLKELTIKKINSNNFDTKYFCDCHSAQAVKEKLHLQSMNI